MKNLFLVTFAWLMMIAIIGSVIYSMLFLGQMYVPHDETFQYFWCCFTAAVLIPAYKGIYYIHSLWLKMLKEYRASSYREEEVKEIPFFQEVTNRVDEVHPLMQKKERRIAPREELTETLRKIRSEANSKLSQLRTEDIANTKKDSHYFVSKYTSEKNILVDTIFEGEQEAAPERAVVEKSEEVLQPVSSTPVSDKEEQGEAYPVEEKSSKAQNLRAVMDTEGKKAPARKPRKQTGKKAGKRGTQTSKGGTHKKKE